MSETPPTYAYTYKDGRRDYWRLEVTRGHTRPDGLDPDGVDYWWNYTLTCESGESVNGVWLGQGDQEPRPHDVLEDVAYRFVTLAVGFAMHARPVDPSSGVTRNA